MSPKNTKAVSTIFTRHTASTTKRLCVVAAVVSILSCEAKPFLVNQNVVVLPNNYHNNFSGNDRKSYYLGPYLNNLNALQHNHDSDATNNHHHTNDLLVPRGGANYNNRRYNDEYEDDAPYYDDDDEYGDGYDGEEYDVPPPPRRGPPERQNNNQRQRPPPTRRSPPPPQERRGGERPSRPPPHTRSRPPPSGGRRRNNQPSSSKNQSTQILDQTTKVAKQTLDMATSATITTLKGTGRAAYYLTAPKYVQRNEIIGVWRLDQVIPTEGTCAANVELTPKGEVVTNFKDMERHSIYYFKPKSWPRSCTIEFEADAFQGPNDAEPVRYYYKGSFRRKMVDKNVIKIVGKIYEVKQSKGGFWSKGKGGGGGGSSGVEVGTFVARRRIGRPARSHDDYDDELEGDYYDDYDEYDVNGYDEYDEE